MTLPSLPYPVLARVAMAAGLAVVVLLGLHGVVSRPAAVQRIVVADPAEGFTEERWSMMPRVVSVEHYIAPGALPLALPTAMVPVPASVVASAPPALGSVAKPDRDRPIVRPAPYRTRSRTVYRDRAEREDRDGGPAICRGKGRYWIGRSWRCNR